MRRSTSTPTDDPALRIFELYHENSKQRRFDIEFSHRVYIANKSAAFHEVVSRTFKRYPGAEFIPLPTIRPGEGPPFEFIAAMRRSIRRFDGQSLSLDQLAHLLHFGAGITGRLDTSDQGTMQPVRAAPSGGALYPIEIYVAAMAVEGLEVGLYHYAVDRRGLELLRRGNLVGPLSEATWDLDMISRSAVVLIFTGMFGRSHFKYGERGYRFALLEAGHICQNVLLEATSLRLGAVAVGGFIDNEINEMLDVDGVDEAAIYLVALGQPAARPSTTTGMSQHLVERLLASLSARVQRIGDSS